MEKPLYLVGTVHIDPDGKERLDYLLEKIKPSTVALEFHKDRIIAEKDRKSHEEQKKELEEIINESGLKLKPEQKSTLIDSNFKMNEIMGFEVRSSNDYL